jgi:hypothetical protein
MTSLILNLLGVLGAEHASEKTVARATSSGGFDYVIMRPQRLVRGPFINLDASKLLQIEGGDENGAPLEVGDTLLGDCTCLTVSSMKTVRMWSTRSCQLTRSL